MRTAWTAFWWGSLAVVDVVCFACVLTRAGSSADFDAALAVHVAVSMLCALLAAWVAPPLAHRRPGALAALAGVLALFVPVIGVAAVGALTTLGLGVRPARRANPWLSLDLERDADDLVGRASSGRPRHVSAAVLAGVLRDRSPDNAEQRFQALLRVRHLPERAGVVLLKQALKDPSDEVRLFAFTRIERLRDALEKSTKGFLAALDASASGEQGFLHMRLAECYWEVAYLRLAEGAVLEHTLGRVLEHAEKAAATRREHAPADFLRGRALLALERYDEATAAFAAAASAGYPRHKVLPYAAECAFQRRQFDSVRAVLSELEATRGHAALQPIVGFWR